MRVDLAAEPGSDWDAYVEAQPGAALGHAGAWARVVREAYRLSSTFLTARDESGALAGVLPLVRVRGLTGGVRLVSMPFLDSGGVLAGSPEAERALLSAAAECARGAGARDVELRQLQPLEGAPPAEAMDRVDLVLPLEADEDAQWKAFRAKVRNQTRKAEKEGLRVRGAFGQELIGDFWEPFEVNMRDLGSPVHARRFFEVAADAFGERMRTIVTYVGDRPVGGLIAIRSGDTVTVPWASTLRSERRRCPNNLIYWEALRWAIAGGAREFDFGRSPIEGGTYRFKKGWGAEERPLAWVRLEASGALSSVGRVAAGSALVRLSELWTRLPVPLASFLGPRLRRHLAN